MLCSRLYLDTLVAAPALELSLPYTAVEVLNVKVAAVFILFFASL
jgi:hypothetical protein